MQLYLVRAGGLNSSLAPPSPALICVRHVVSVDARRSRARRVPRPIGEHHLAGGRLRGPFCVSVGVLSLLWAGMGEVAAAR